MNAAKYHILEFSEFPKPSYTDERSSINLFLCNFYCNSKPQKLLLRSVQMNNSGECYILKKTNGFCPSNILKKGKIFDKILNFKKNNSNHQNVKLFCENNPCDTNDSCSFQRSFKPAENSTCKNYFSSLNLLCADQKLLPLNMQDFLCYPNDTTACSLRPKFGLLACNDTLCHNGTCFEEGTSIYCKCHDGFEGTMCEKDICKPNPCKNGGLCLRVRSEKSYLCRCIRGFTGPNCEINLGHSFSGEVLPNGGLAWGSWTDWSMCPTGYYLGGAGLQVGLYFNDKVRIKSVKFLCKRLGDDKFGPEVSVIDDGSLWKG